MLQQFHPSHLCFQKNVRLFFVWTSLCHQPMPWTAFMDGLATRRNSARPGKRVFRIPYSIKAHADSTGDISVVLTEFSFTLKWSAWRFSMFFFSRKWLDIKMDESSSPYSCCCCCQHHPDQNIFWQQQWHRGRVYCLLPPRWTLWEFFPWFSGWTNRQYENPLHEKTSYQMGTPQQPTMST